MSTLAAAAEQYCKLGIAVFPCEIKGKRPISGLRGGWQTASASPTVARQRWLQWPDANVGAVPPPGMCALDIDPRNGGHYSLEALEAQYGELPPTLTAATPSGGKHLFFKIPLGRKLKKNIAPGLELFTHGRGYVLVSPSVTTKRYEWLDTEEFPSLDDIADAPEWLLELAAEPDEVPSSSSATGVGYIIPQQRAELADALQHLDADDYAVWVECGMALHSSGAPDAFELWCEWAQRSSKYDYRASLEKWKTFGRHRAGGVTLATVFKRAADAGWENPLSRSSVVQLPIPQAAQRFRVVPAGQAQKKLDSVYFIKGVILDKALNEVYGPPKSGKTFFAMDLGVHIADGRSWRGKRVRKAGVIYAAAENPDSVERRLIACCEHLRVDAANLPFLILRGHFAMQDGTHELPAFKQAAEQLRNDYGVERVLIVIDTLARASAGMDENEAADMGRFIGNCDRLREEIDCGVLVIHHTGKDIGRGARGHSSLLGAVDVEILINEGAATIENGRDVEEGEPMPFQLMPVQLGVDSDGDAVTTCVVLHADLSAFIPPPAREPSTSNQRLVWRALKEALADYGEQMPGTSAIPQGVKAVRKEHIVDKAAPLLTCDSKHKKSRINEALAGLRDGAFVGICDPWVWLL